MSDPEFLTLDEVLGIHSDQIGRYGGAPGIRDLGLLQSALSMPQATFDDLVREMVEADTKEEP